MTHSIEVNGERLWSSLMEMANIGATEAGGCNRQALTDQDKQGRDLFCGWCVAAGCRIQIDKMGNIFAIRPGRNNSSPVVMTGSHLDTQPTGGKFDGVFGVLAGLEVVRRLNNLQFETEAPIAVCVWTNEEGARFSPAMIGSGVWCGEFDISYGRSRTDKSGRTLGDELERIGYLGEHGIRPNFVKAYFEAHIEQGPILEEKGCQIGVVEGVQGIHWYDLTVTGKPAHAGPTPMESRRDPVMALPLILNGLYALAREFSPWARVTFGDLSAVPGSRNTVPESVTLAIDLRHPEQGLLDDMEERLNKLAAQVCEKFDLGHRIKTEWKSSAVRFDRHCFEAVKKAADVLKYSNMKMVSGAGHDAVYVSRVTPTAMIFIPCEGGISHNEAENIKMHDAVAGANVLLNAVVSVANGANE